MDIMAIVKEGFFGSLDAVKSIAIVVIPLMFAMEVLKELKVLDILSSLLKPIMKFLGLSKESSFPLLVGLTLGLAYGAGVIINSAQDGALSKKDLYLLMIFLVTCHSVIEDTLIFVKMGANGWLLLGIRVPLAIILTIIVSKKMKVSTKQNKDTL